LILDTAQGPGVALGLGLFENDGKPFEEEVAVIVVAEVLLGVGPQQPFNMITESP